MRGVTNGVIFPKGDPLPETFSKHCVGRVYLEMLVPGENVWNCPIGNVTFEPGCRNNWH